MDDKLYENDHFDAFISYRHETGFYMAQIIYDKLIYNGYTVFMDKTMDSGKFEDMIESAVAKARNFIMVLFPGDLDKSTDDTDWLYKEASWAAGTPNINIIPILCDNFKWPEALPDCLLKVKQSNGIPMHKDYSLDQDLDKLCDRFLKNANPIKPLINTKEFFDKNLKGTDILTVKGIDLAFHGGASWFRKGVEKEVKEEIIRRKIPMRILINTPKAAMVVTRHMHDSNAAYTSFRETARLWKKFAAGNPDLVEVRVCSVPLLHVHQGITYLNTEKNTLYGRLHIKYYAHQNFNLDNAFEHEISSFSKYYSVYQNEFEYLWEKSKKL